MLKRLEAAGLVRRQRDTADERQVRVQLTAAGRALHDKARRLPGWFENTFCEKSEEARALHEGIIKLREQLLHKNGEA
ncbi:MarR family winged helix-turn-helix transcriptional regulator [Pseudoroseomonas wenyumeiae]